MKAGFKCLFLAAAGTLLAACSSTALNPMPGEMNSALGQITGQNGRACLRIRDIRGYAAISDSVISANMLRRNQALLITSRRCPGLQTTSAAVFDGRFTEICGGGRDFVVTAAERCNIRSIFEFESRQAAFDALEQAEELIRDRRQES